MAARGPLHAAGDEPGLLRPRAEREEGRLAGKLAGDNERLRNGMERLYRLFKEAPVLGSLINPRAAEGDLLVAAFHELQPLLEKALAQETKDDTAHEMAVTARGLAKAAEILAGQFTLVATNVPYLGRGKQEDVLKHYLDGVYSESRWDLATAFVERCKTLCAQAGAVSLVTPSQWCTGDKYISFRNTQIRRTSWNIAARLGTNAFETISGEVVNVILMILSCMQPEVDHIVNFLDLSGLQLPSDKEAGMRTAGIQLFNQVSQLKNPDKRVTFRNSTSQKLLGAIAKSTEGLSAGDGERFIVKVWEKPCCDSDWRFLQTAPERTSLYCGLTDIVLWEDGNGEMARSDAARIRGHSAWGKPGVVVAKMNGVRASVYLGALFAKNCAVLSTATAGACPAVLEFVTSPAFNDEVQRLDGNLNTATSVFEKVPIDLAYWQKMATEKYPEGLPKPFSSDPTQWVFNGHPKNSDQGLHVAVARLVGYQWPRQTGSRFPDCPALDPDGLEKLADTDGIVCLSATKDEASAAERLRGLLVQALGPFDLRALISRAGPKGSRSETLEEWLRDEFFEQHCTLFHQRPFIWHIWDGHKSGFSALVNYHKLTHANLENLTYVYMGDWIRRQQAAVDSGEAGSDLRLQAAKQLQARLKLILEGEPPYDWTCPDF